VRNVELTPAGEQFLPLAEQWAALYNDIGQIKKETARNDLRIGCPDTLSDCLLLPLFAEVLYLTPPLHLDITTYHSKEVVRAVAERRVDVSLGFYQRSISNVISLPVFREIIRVLLFEPTQELKAKAAVHPSELLRKDEIFTYWSPGIQQWHDSWWERNEKPYASIDTLPQMKQLMRRPGQWMIIPSYMVDAFSDDRRFHVKSFSTPAPNRICYLFKHRYPELQTKKNVSMFENRLFEYCKKSDSIEVITG